MQLIEEHLSEGRVVNVFGAVMVAVQRICEAGMLGLQQCPPLWRYHCSREWPVDPFSRQFTITQYCGDTG